MCEDAYCSNAAASFNFAASQSGVCDESNTAVSLPRPKRLQRHIRDPAHNKQERMFAGVSAGGRMASKRLFDGLFDTEGCRVDHVVAKVGCCVFDVLTTATPWTWR